jgi:hypothetical protein
LTTSLKEQESVKVLEQESVGLMDGTQDLLTGGSEFSEESNNVVSGLTIKTGSGLVEEK